MTIRSDHAIGIRRQAEKIAEATARDEKRLRLRRFVYYRNRHSRLDDPRLRLAAQMAGAPLYLVEAFVQRLDMFASAATPRGSVEGLSIEALALHWGIRPDLVARLYASLEDPRIGWIDSDFVVDFWAENPDTEDRTANDRQERSRKFRAALNTIGNRARTGKIDEATRAALEREILLLRERARRHKVDRAAWKTALSAILDETPPKVEATNDQKNLSQRDSVTVTARSDEHFSTAGSAVDNAAGAAAGGSAARGLSEGKTADAAAAAPDPAGWLETEGYRLFTERCQVRPERATLDIHLLRRQLGPQWPLLADFIRDAALMGLEGERFTDRLRAEIRRAVTERDKGPGLPLMMSVPQRKR